MLTISPAALNEANSVIEIIVGAAQWLELRGIPTWDPETLPALMTAAITRGEVYLAWLEGRPVGTFTILWSDPTFWGERPDDAGYIHKVAIARSAAGKQVGQQMLDWAEQLIASRGRPYARLDCHAENPTINRYYQTAGYQLRGTIIIKEVSYSIYEKSLR